MVCVYEAGWFHFISFHLCSVWYFPRTKCGYALQQQQQKQSKKTTEWKMNSSEIQCFILTECVCVCVNYGYFSVRSSVRERFVSVCNSNNIDAERRALSFQKKRNEKTKEKNRNGFTMLLKEINSYMENVMSKVITISSAIFSLVAFWTFPYRPITHYYSTNFYLLCLSLSASVCSSSVKYNQLLCAVRWLLNE